VDGLVEWLRAQLDEDEQAARRAGDSFRQVGETGVIVATEGDRAEECASANWAGIAEHIVRHDPARVLREIDAKRRILAECAYWHGKLAKEAVDPSPMPFPALGEVLDAVTPILRALALPYADRPGYREEWRP
jgi:hypothetical protein